MSRARRVARGVPQARHPLELLTAAERGLRDGDAEWTGSRERDALRTAMLSYIDQAFAGLVEMRLGLLEYQYRPVS